jgi:hypothetical protein
MVAHVLPDAGKLLICTADIWRASHLRRESCHAGLHQWLYIVLAELKAICYLLKILNCYFAGPLIALCYPQGVYSLIKENLSLQYMR